MHFFILVLLFCFLIFLFCLFEISREDFVFLRKSVTTERLFNLAFLTMLVGLFCARVAYVLFHPSTTFLNPLAFLLFPYFPGLSLSGGIVGVAGFMYLYGGIKKLPVGRVSDFFSLCFLSALPFGSLLFFVLSGGKQNLILAGVTFFVYLLLFLIFLFQLLPIHRLSKMKEGRMSFLSLTLALLVALIIT
ncbi:MAG TPA: prolipoprotein diacylglyceryl transferase family protein, partial [Candidatus Saccharimonadales bacterium]|nr:prolipoprotein diacylglyceryl transferase family protein [Candidatus Saccharimonadales bacterium]